MATKAPPVAFRLTPEQMYDLRTVAKAEGCSPGQLAARLVTNYVAERTSNVLHFTPRPNSEARHPSVDRAARIATILAKADTLGHTDGNTPPDEGDDQHDAVQGSPSPSDPPAPG